MSHLELLRLAHKQTGELRATRHKKSSSYCCCRAADTSCNCNLKARKYRVALAANSKQDTIELQKTITSDAKLAKTGAAMGSTSSWATFRASGSSRCFEASQLIRWRHVERIRLMQRQQPASESRGERKQRAAQSPLGTSEVELKLSSRLAAKSCVTTR